MKHIKTYIQLKESLNEALDNGKVKIVLLSNTSEESNTVPTIKAECKKQGVPFTVISIDKATLTKKPDSESFVITDGDSTATISSDDTAILTRRGVVKSTYTRSIVQQLEESGFFVVNTLESILSCENKYTTSKILMDAGIPIPRMALIEDDDGLEDAVESIGGQFPVVLKMLSGSHGIGVSIVDSIASLKSVIQTIWKANKTVELLIQEKIDSDYDLRIHVLTRRFNSPSPADTDSVLLGYMRRNRVNDDFRTNYHLGGTVEKTKVTPEQESIAIESAKAIGCNWCGVDIIVDKKSGKNYVLEVNSSPGTEGLKKATGVDVVKDVIEFVVDKQNWIKNQTTIGFRESVTIPGIGDVIGKFDTGNGTLSCSLTYDKKKLSEDEKTVTWKLGNKEFTSNVIGFSSAEVGETKHNRPIIEMDVVFAGKIYKDVHISLVDRTEKSTKFLVNRKFMERIGCSVNPYQTFIKTSFSGEYSPISAKGNNHTGIKFE
jgi:ribosomal protein S6--L-glutamate ligase